MSSARRARQRARRALGLVEAPLVIPRDRIVCDRCGQEQPFRTASDTGDEFSAPCVGPLGLPCDGETAAWLDSYTAGSVPSAA